MIAVRVQPVLASWCGKAKAASVEEGGISWEGGISGEGVISEEGTLSDMGGLELPRSVAEVESRGEAAADKAEPMATQTTTQTATPTANNPPSAQAAGGHTPATPAAEVAIPIASCSAITAAVVVVPTLNVGNTDDFLSRLAAAESGERGSSSREQ